MLLSPIVTGHCQGQILLLWQNPILVRLRGYHPLRQHVPEHFSSENGILYAIAHYISTTLPWQIQFGLFRFRRSEEHTSELQSRQYLVCRLLLEKKKKKK